MIIEMYIADFKDGGRGPLKARKGKTISLLEPLEEMQPYQYLDFIPPSETCV